MTKQEVNDAEWADPANWYGGFLGIYHSRRDSRLVVPKRVRAMGWTINAAHPIGRFVLLAAPVAGIVAIIAAIRDGR